MYDAIIVGGGIAGFSAALILGRARRKVLLLDAGSPRNAPATHAHGYLTRDNTPPEEMMRLAREEIAAYSTVTIEAASASDATSLASGFRVDLKDGRGLETRKLLLATGMVDVLPDIPGLQQLWGRGVNHCPYCHGWEVRDQKWAILGEPFAVERATIFRGWTSDLIVLANGPSSLEDKDRARLVALSAALDERIIVNLGRVSDNEVQVSFDDGSILITGAVFVMPVQVQRAGLAEALGCELYDGAPMDARFVRVDPVSGETSVGGVYAAGDMIGPMQSLILAAASGARAAYMLNHALAAEDMESAFTS
jgi:thioredoxin reductase